MSLYIKGGGGITKLSELIIDVDKNWLTFGITNLKELAAAMAKGDLPVRGAAILQRLTPGAIGLVLTSDGPGHLPVWAPCGGAYEYYFVAPIELTHTEAVVTPDQVIEKECQLPTEHEENYLDAPLDYIKRLTPAIACAKAGAVVTPDASHNVDSPVGTGYSLQLLVGGAASEDGGVFANETAAAKDAVANDMNLLPPVGGGLAVDDAYYFGFAYTFDRVWLNIGQAAAGNYALAHEYWNGVAWTALAGLVDDTSEFTIAGLNKIEFTVPGDWALTNEGGSLPANLYWIRARVTAVNTYTQQPLGTQAWCEIIA